mgnify:CR=1 FL=1
MPPTMQRSVRSLSVQVSTVLVYKQGYAYKDMYDVRPMGHQNLSTEKEQRLTNSLAAPNTCPVSSASACAFAEAP